jgi:hypothetical protein
VGGPCETLHAFLLRSPRKENIDLNQCRPVRAGQNFNAVTKEVAMTGRAVPAYPVVDFVIGAIGAWIRNYRCAAGLNDEFSNCGPDEVKAIANDMGMTPADLQALAMKGPGAADLLKEMIVALKADPAALHEMDQRTTRELQKLCIGCGEKRRCEHELAAGTAATNMHEFCPNAAALKTRFGQRPRSNPR